MSTKETKQDIIFELEVNMRTAIQKFLDSIGIGNSRFFAIAIMGIILPYMTAFAYKDNDPITIQNHLNISEPSEKKQQEK